MQRGSFHLLVQGLQFLIELFNFAAVHFFIEEFIFLVFAFAVDRGPLFRFIEQIFDSFFHRFNLLGQFIIVINRAHNVVNELRRNLSRLQAKTRNLFDVIGQENCGSVCQRVCVGRGNVSGGFV